MSVLDVKKNKEVKKVKEKIEKGVKPLKQKEKRYFSKIRTAVKKTKK